MSVVDRRAIAVKAGVDPRTVDRFLVAGMEPRSPSTRAAIVSAMKRLGYPLAMLLEGTKRKRVRK